MTPSLPYYPWYVVVSGHEIHQGDILEACPIFAPVDNETTNGELEVTPTRRDVVVMTHSCDMQRGKIAGSFAMRFGSALGHTNRSQACQARQSNLELARKGQLLSFHVLAECDFDGYRRELSVIDFRHVYTLPFDFVRREAERRLHLRLLPPYREHMSQAFARLFMRVGLPADIPPIR